MTATLFLREDVDLALELGVRGDGARLGQDHAALEGLLVDAAEEDTDVLAGAPLVEGLLEHLDTGAGRVTDLFLHTDDLERVARADDAALDPAGADGAAPLDGEHVLDGHQEVLVHVTLGERDVAVDRCHELVDALERVIVGALAVVEGVLGAEGGATDDREIIAGELVLGEKLADLHLDEIEELLVVDLVDLVHEHHDGRHVDLTGEQDVLAGLGHRAVRCGDHEDRAVHLGGTRDHVLDVVGVSGAIDVGVVTRFGLILDVGRRDGDTTRLLLRRLVDHVERHCLREAFGGLVAADGGGEGGLPVVDVTDGPDVHVVLVPLEDFLGHFGCLVAWVSRSPAWAGSWRWFDA